MHRPMPAGVNRAMSESVNRIPLMLKLHDDMRDLLLADKDQAIGVFIQELAAPKLAEQAAFYKYPSIGQAVPEAGNGHLRLGLRTMLDKANTLVASPAAEDQTAIHDAAIIVISHNLASPDLRRNALILYAHAEGFRLVPERNVEKAINSIRPASRIHIKSPMLCAAS